MIELRTPLPSIARASAEEREAIYDRTQREREWYGHFTNQGRRFAFNSQILAAAEAGELVKVHPDANIMPRGTLRNPELHGTFPPYLLPDSKYALEAIGRLWRTKLEADTGPRPAVRLSVTSLARSDEMQDELLKRPDKLAVRGSTHVVAAAFDIDASGYYLLHKDGLASVAHPGRNSKTVDRIGKRLMKAVDSPYRNAETSAVYDPTVVEALLDVTGYLHRAGLINEVVEYQGTANQCVHIAPNPDTVLSLEG